MLAVVLIVSASVLAAAALKSKPVSLMLDSKKARNLGLGAFFMSVSWLAQAACFMDVALLERVQLASVSDGDTLRLVNGEKVRVIGLNTPELARKGRRAQPLAEEAKRAVSGFLGDKLYIQRGRDAKDRYGRTLAHVYRSDGQSLSAELIAQGLAWQVVVPDNTGQWSCYRAEEQQARRLKRGVWRQSALSVEQLTTGDAGFQVVKGRVESVYEGRHRWWLNMNGLAVSVSKKDQRYFDEAGMSGDWRVWQGKVIHLKGWVIDRSKSQSVIKRGYAPLMMSLRHPSMLLD